MARFVSSLHPRNPRNGKFVKRGTGGGVVSRPKRRKSPQVATRAPTQSGLKKNFTRAVAAYQVQSDVREAFSSGAKAYAYGATGNYVKSALHGAKASTATARLGSRAARVYVERKKSIAPARKKQLYASINKFDDRVQTVDNVATIGLLLTGSVSRRKSKGGSANGDYIKRKALSPAKARKGAYQISSLKGGKVRK